jgi:hypothetical protein
MALGGDGREDREVSAGPIVEQALVKSVVVPVESMELDAHENDRQQTALGGEEINGSSDSKPKEANYASPHMREHRSNVGTADGGENSTTGRVQDNPSNNLRLKFFSLFT